MTLVKLNPAVSKFIVNTGCARQYSPDETFFFLPYIFRRTNDLPEDVYEMIHLTGKPGDDIMPDQPYNDPKHVEQFFRQDFLDQSP